VSWGSLGGTLGHFEVTLGHPGPPWGTYGILWGPAGGGQGWAGGARDIEGSVVWALGPPLELYTYPGQVPLAIECGPLAIDEGP
jgi:hypothetical protein